MLRHSESAKDNRRALILATVLMILIACVLPLAAQDAATVSGIVKDASGQPVEGAFVRIRGVDSKITFMVVSQAQGRYSSPNLPTGKYMVETIGGEYQSASAWPVDVSSGQPAKMDVVLGAPRKAAPERRRLTQADYAAVMPEAPGKAVILSKCVTCHDMEGVDLKTLTVLSSRQEWEELIGVHQTYTAGRPDHLSNDEIKLVLDYMTENFSREGHPVRLPREKDDHSDGYLPRTLLKGAEAKYVVVEFDLGQYAHPHDITADSEGIAWLGEHGWSESGPTGGGGLGRIDPKTLTFTQVVPPPGRFAANSFYFGGTAVDPQGVVWDTENGRNARLVAYNPKTGQFKTYDIPAPAGRKDLSNSGAANINTLRFQDGFVWGSGLLSMQIYKVDPASGGVITYPVPEGRPPYGMAFDKDKMLWYAAQFADEVDKIDPATGKRTGYKVLTPHADLRHLQTDAEGNAWASAEESDRLIEVNARTGEVSEFEPPTKQSSIDTVDVDRKHNLIWVGESQAGKLARFDPKTKTFVEFPLAIAGTDVKRVTVDPSNPNRVWWCSDGASRAGYVEVTESAK